MTNQKKFSINRPPKDLCIECVYKGPPIKFVKYRGEEKTELYRCTLHPTVKFTKYAAGCSDCTKAL